MDPGFVSIFLVYVGGPYTLYIEPATKPAKSTGNQCFVRTQIDL